MTTDTNERAREAINAGLRMSLPGRPDEDPFIGSLSYAVRAAIKAANLAIIDTRTHRPVRVRTFDKDDPSTWPKTEKEYLTRWLGEKKFEYRSWRTPGGYHPNQWVNTWYGKEVSVNGVVGCVQEWIDPADLTGEA